MPKITRVEPSIITIQRPKRVAAYARVSMETELLHHSLSAQISHYSKLIQKNPEWEYAGVYADEGITGTSRKYRNDFNRLIADCDAGKIDIILVKSISRFARNTVDLLETVRHLKDIGVEVRFERENISTFTTDGELLLTLLASFAQAESESISANEKWVIKKKFENGESNTGLRCFGYDWDSENKGLIVNEKEAEWVRYIYTSYLNGASIKGLAKEMSEKGVIAVRGDSLARSTIRRILTSETYVGDIILQRYYSPTVHNPKLNTGQMPQYVVSDAHEPIISREDFEKVQERLNKRAKNAANAGYQKTFFAGLVKCGKCGFACNHVKKKSNKATSVYIECNHRKTNECDLMPIWEYRLKEIMEQMVGEKDAVEKIIMFDDHIDFYRKKGEPVIYSREYQPTGRRPTVFSGHIECGECGRKFTRTNCRWSESGKSWTCLSKKTDKDACTVPFISEDYLIYATKQILNTEKYEMEFYLNIEKVLVFEDRLEFHMKEGEIRTWQREM